MLTLTIATQGQGGQPAPQVDINPQHIVSIETSPQGGALITMVTGQKFTLTNDQESVALDAMGYGVRRNETVPAFGTSTVPMMLSPEEMETLWHHVRRCNDHECCRTIAYKCRVKIKAAVPKPIIDPKSTKRQPKVKR